VVLMEASATVRKWTARMQSSRGALAGEQRCHRFGHQGVSTLTYCPAVYAWGMWDAD